MRREHRHPAGPRPYDEYDGAVGDVAQEFWGATREWAPDPSVGRHHTGQHDGLTALPGDDDSMWSERTGSIQAIRDGFAAFKPRRAEAPRRNLRGGIDRTRSHGIVRPTDLPPDDDRPTGRQPVERHAELAPDVAEASLAELAGGRRRALVDTDWPQLDDDWSLPTGSTPRLAPARAEAPRRPVSPVPDLRHRPTEADWPDLDDWSMQADDRDALEFDEWDRQELPLTASSPLAERLGLGAVDPLLLRLGVLVLVGALLGGFALARRGDDVSIATADAAAAAVAPAANQSAPVATPTAVPTTLAAVPATPAADPAAGATSQSDDQPPAGPADDADASTSESDADDADDASAVADDTASDAPSAKGGATGDRTQTIAATTPPEVATVSEDADRVEPECALTYAANPGDSWYRIADQAGIAVGDLLEANLASLDSLILPGDDICLPEGATMPSPPSTTAAPTTTAAPSTAAPTTAATTTTTAPPTTSSTVTPVSTAEVQRLIREIWPDDLEEKALQIAYRESTYRYNAYNGICCYGVFQIHWVSHRSWLDDYGILTTNDLFDARKNITAAYALYQRAGGWGPWGG